MSGETNHPRPRHIAVRHVAVGRVRRRAPILIVALGLGGCAGEAADLGPYFDHSRATTAPAARAVYPAATTTGPDATVASVAYDPLLIEQSVFTRINLHRATLGLPALRHHSRLAEAAGEHSRRMAAGAAVSHDGMRQRLGPFLGGLFGHRAGGEILAVAGATPDPARTAMASWLASYRHRNVIEEDYTRMGVGVARRAGGYYYLTVLFLR